MSDRSIQFEELVETAVPFSRETAGIEHPVIRTGIGIVIEESRVQSEHDFGFQQGAVDITQRQRDVINRPAGPVIPDDLDLGILFGWGDIRDHIADGFNKSKSADDILADRMTEMRNKAAETAASILAGKLGIE